MCARHAGGCQPGRPARCRQVVSQQQNPRGNHTVVHAPLARPRPAPAPGHALRGVVLALAVALAGCAGYRDNSGRTFGEITDDVAIQTSVKSRLIADADAYGNDDDL